MHGYDPEFMERFAYFAHTEVVQEEGQQLEPGTRYMAILAVLIGCQAADAYREILPNALDSGVSPVEVKEIVYQATDYVGYGRMLPFLHMTNEHQGGADAGAAGDDYVLFPDGARQYAYGQ